MATDAISADNLYAFGVKHVTKGLGRITEGIMTKGEGSYVVYDDGRRMLDFTCGIGVTNLGGLLFLGDGFMLWRFPGGWASNASKLWDTPSTPHPLAKPPWPIYTPARFDDKREGHPTIFGPRLQINPPYLPPHVKCCRLSPLTQHLESIYWPYFFVYAGHVNPRVSKAAADQCMTLVHSQVSFVFIFFFCKWCNLSW